jgi:hypothetical protein
MQNEPLRELAWLADAPLFIDGPQVTAFYEAVVAPSAHEKRITISLKNLEGKKTIIGGAAKAEIGLTDWLATVFPFISAKGEIDVKAERERQLQQERGQVIELEPISSPHRQLIYLAFHYAAQLPHRLKIVADPAKDSSWYEPEFVAELPRALVFLDFQRGAQFIPMAAEVDAGKVVLMHVEAACSFVGARENPNPPPDDKQLKGRELDAAWARYWQWYADNFHPLRAIDVIEKTVADGGRIRWIDYRVPLIGGKTVHLHVCGRGEYDTGVFAYNTVRRAWRYGMRLVGTVKSSPDINVLAMFDK